MPALQFGEPTLSPSPYLGWISGMNMHEGEGDESEIGKGGEKGRAGVEENVLGEGGGVRGSAGDCS